MFMFTQYFYSCVLNLVQWHRRKTVDWVWEQCWSDCTLLWLKAIGNWRKLHDVWLHKLYRPQILLELRKKGRWMAGSCRVHVTWGMCTGLSETRNHNEQLPLLLRAYMHTKLQTWHINCCHGWLNSPSQNLLHIHSSNTVNTLAPDSCEHCLPLVDRTFKLSTGPLTLQLHVPYESIYMNITFLNMNIFS